MSATSSLISCKSLSLRAGEGDFLSLSFSSDLSRSAADLRSVIDSTFSALIGSVIGFSFSSGLFFSDSNSPNDFTGSSFRSSGIFVCSSRLSVGDFAKIVSAGEISSDRRDSADFDAVISRLFLRVSASVSNFSEIDVGFSKASSTSFASNSVFSVLATNGSTGSTFSAFSPAVLARS